MKALFEQSGIKIQKEQEFGTLKGAIERVLAPALIEKFFKKLDGNGIRIREFEKVLEKRVLESVDEVLAKSGQSASQLYSALVVTDQGQMREFYLTRIEEVSPELRQKFHKLYSYY
ncbi:MAG TPA: hypothetical protein VN577_16095 [Terriglobales bacterium]|nr:hypothetical protein [Terriglobales bacterium]